jgi:hypothetical protein
MSNLILSSSKRHVVSAKAGTDGHHDREADHGDRGPRSA